MMDSSFYKGNRGALYARLPEDFLLVLFAGRALRKTADEYYPFFTNRNFVYLTGVGDACAEGFVLMARRAGGILAETLYILPPDAHAERWQGRRMRPEEAREISGVDNIAYASEFTGRFHEIVSTEGQLDLWLDLDRHKPDEPESETHSFAGRTARNYPFLRVNNVHPHLRALRTIKQSCEVDAMKKAMTITRDAIIDMMRASRPGMYEYEYKAIFDAALTRNGVLAPGFPPIISAGANNFCIHYYAYTGQAQDGDMVLNDVGARWDYMGNDVSRGWPCNGVFSEKQRLLYTCAYNTSEHMFRTIRPGMPMASVDQTARKYCYEQLKSIGLADRYEDVGKYIWHGGAHHVGFDTHDAVDLRRPVSPGMVFCVDIGIYCEEWGIGFRLEDNCLVTETGCINLSADIPRSIEEIEAVMHNK
ncbi:MAG: Xaa-Pro peptidase family protein [Clostridia bacterium]|nr:Xaa-Pro peptidase family protein [Clostridia bacterium]